MAFHRDDPVIQMTATELIKNLRQRAISREEVVRAYVDRIVTIDGRVGAYVEVLRGEALSEARRWDEHPDESLPLAGLPVSIKENLDMTGRASTLGILARKNHRAKSDAAIVRAVRRAGGIVIGRTNVPQLLLSHESRNPVFGATKNPWSLAHAPGGSSGGEAAALAAGLSAGGIGTDIGGSIRVPAAWCGISGLKPTLDRWSNRGSNGALTGQEAVRSQVGPLARTARDVALLFRSLDPIAMGADDPLVAPLPIRDVSAIDIKGLTVGYFCDDGFLQISSAVRRAIREAVEVLKERGVKTIPFTVPSTRKALSTYFGLLSADGGVTAFSLLEGTTLEPTLAGIKRAAELPDAARALLAGGLRTMGEERPAWFLSQVGKKSVTELWALTKLARDYRLELLDRMREAGVDVLVCHPHATPPVGHGQSTEFALAGAASMLFNLVQFPAGVVPVTRVRASEIGDRRKFVDRFDRTAAAVDKASEGLPVGVQVVGRPFCDEEVLAVMMAIEDGTRGVIGAPVTPVFPPSADAP